MRLNTASEVISFSKDMEMAGSKFYQDLATAYPEGREKFLDFAKENEKFIKQIERAYYSVISDALEGGFAFDLDPEAYRLQVGELQSLSTKEKLKMARDLENKTVDFYEDAAEQSMSLMADVPKAFKMVVKKRSRRQEMIKAMEADQ